MTQPLPPGPFGLILMDPPWAFITYNGAKVPQRAEKQHYGTMSLDELKALDLLSIAAKDCALVMWVVDSHLDQAIELGKHYGFTYKTRLLTWRKPSIGMGHWTRKETEIALLFTRGKPKRIGKGVREVIDAPRREHSRKPDEQYERLEALLGDIPRLEMFARFPRAGWSQWGNEVPGLVNLLGRLETAVESCMP